MNEPDQSDELQTQIDEAVQANDAAKASELYRKQIGNVDPHGDEAAASVPAVVDGDVDGKAEAPGPSPSDVQGMGGSGMADSRRGCTSVSGCQTISGTWISLPRRPVV